jgi:hypothetical protein
MLWTIRWLGRLVGALSLFSLAVKGFFIGLAPMFASILEAYDALKTILRPIIEPVVLVIMTFIPFESPIWPDIVMLWFLQIASLGRALSSSEPDIKDGLTLKLATWAFLALNVALVGLFVYIIFIIAETRTDFAQRWYIYSLALVAAYLVFVWPALLTPVLARVSGRSTLTRSIQLYAYELCLVFSGFAAFLLLNAGLK